MPLEADCHRCSRVGFGRPTDGTTEAGDPYANCLVCEEHAKTAKTRLLTIESRLSAMPAASVLMSSVEFGEHVGFRHVASVIQ